MTLKLEWKKKLVTQTDRVKAVDLHPTETWVLAALYNGQLIIYDYSTQSLTKSIEASSQPLRCGRFVARENWVVCAGDDLKVRVYDYLTLEKVTSFDAHSDYIRSIAVHATLPLLLTAADDLTVKCWNWEKGWARVQSYESHAHYVMMVAWSPRDPQQFASASLDRTIKVWSVPAVGASNVTPIQYSPDFTLSGHERGVNSIAYALGDKPYLISGSDDMTIRVWDYHSRQCLQILSGHSKNVCHAIFHPYLPLIISCSEDGTMMVWNSTTYREENIQLYDAGRLWGISIKNNSNDIAVATDDGTLVIAIGNEKPVITMYQGKLLYVKGVEIYMTNVRTCANAFGTNDGGPPDGEKLLLSVKEVGSVGLYPQSISYNPSNGRLVSVCGDGEYSILTAQALRNKAYGEGFDIVWSIDGQNYAIRELDGRIRVYYDFNELINFKPSFNTKDLHGNGPLLCLNSGEFICFYDWGTTRFIRRIDVSQFTGLYWNDSGSRVCVATTDGFYVLKYDTHLVQTTIVTNQPETDDGIEAAFELMEDCISENIISGLWVQEECFIYVTNELRLQIYVAGQTDTLAFLPNKQYLLGYLPETSRFYLSDRDINITSYRLSLPYIQFQSQLAQGNIARAEEILRTQVPEAMYEKASKFLAQKNYKSLAFEYTKDQDIKFDLALSMGDLRAASQIVTEMERENTRHKRLVRAKWTALGDVAFGIGEFDLARESYEKGHDTKALLLMGTTLGDPELVRAARLQDFQPNVCFVADLLLHELEDCIDLLVEDNGKADAMLFARSFKPSMLSEQAKPWIESIKEMNTHYASRIALPLEQAETEKFFPHLPAQLELETIFAEFENTHSRSGLKYREWKNFSEYDFVAEFKELGAEQLKEALESVETTDEIEGEPAATPEAEAPAKQTDHQSLLEMDDDVPQRVVEESANAGDHSAIEERASLYEEADEGSNDSDLL